MYGGHARSNTKVVQLHFLGAFTNVRTFHIVFQRSLRVWTSYRVSASAGTPAPACFLCIYYLFVARAGVPQRGERFLPDGKRRLMLVESGDCE